MLHIELRKLAKVLVVAPLSANTMAKLANGMCDNLLTCVFRCWDFRSELARGTVIVAPAMNTYMYEHPITVMQEAMLRDTLGVQVLETVEKVLMCDDVGKGAMAAIDTIVNAVEATFVSFNLCRVQNFFFNSYYAQIY